jgi:hypothetical protein
MKNLTHPRSASAILVGILAALSLLVATPGTAVAAPKERGATSPVVLNDSTAKVTSTITGTTEDGRKVKGRFTPTSFEMVGDTMEATGELTGRIPGEGAFSERVSLPVQSVNGESLDGASSAALAQAAAPSCDILNLVLGPLDLNLLGLEVQLDQVVLDIIAQPGAGNLLGNLLCAVAGLLDGGLGLGALLEELVAVLNDILGQLGLSA